MVRLGNAEAVIPVDELNDRAVSVPNRVVVRDLELFEVLDQAALKCKQKKRVNKRNREERDGGAVRRREEREDARCELALRVHARVHARNADAAAVGPILRQLRRTWRYPLRLVFTAVSTSPSRPAMQWK